MVRLEILADFREPVAREIGPEHSANHRTTGFPDRLTDCLRYFHIFEAVVSRNAAQRKLIDDLLALFGGRSQPVVAHLIESGKLTLEDVKEAEKTLRKLTRKDKSQ